MDWFKKPTEDDIVMSSKKAVPFNPPKFVKTDTHCEVDGCEEPKATAAGQNHVCLKHIRSS